MNVVKGIINQYRSSSGHEEAEEADMASARLETMQNCVWRFRIPRKQSSTTIIPCPGKLKTPPKTKTSKVSRRCVTQRPGKHNWDEGGVWMY